MKNDEDSIMFDCPKCDAPNEQPLASIKNAGSRFHCTFEPCRATLTYRAHIGHVTCDVEGRMHRLASPFYFKHNSAQKPADPRPTGTPRSYRGL
jgi:hypothetical protein